MAARLQGGARPSAAITRRQQRSSQTSLVVANKGASSCRCNARRRPTCAPTLDSSRGSRRTCWRTPNRCSARSRRPPIGGARPRRCVRCKCRCASAGLCLPIAATVTSRAESVGHVARALAHECDARLAPADAHRRVGAARRLRRVSCRRRVDQTARMVGEQARTASIGTLVLQASSAATASVPPTTWRAIARR